MVNKNTFMSSSSSAPIVLSNVEILAHFKDNVINCLDGLIELFPYEKNLIAFRVVFETGVSLDEVMRLFAMRILPLAKMVRDRSNAFFLDEKKSFRLKIGEIEVGWKTLWQSKNLSTQDRDTIWKYMNLFLGLAEMYSKNHGWNIKEEL